MIRRPPTRWIAATGLLLVAALAWAVFVIVDDGSRPLADDSGWTSPYTTDGSAMFRQPAVIAPGPGSGAGLALTSSTAKPSSETARHPSDAQVPRRGSGSVPNGTPSRPRPAQPAASPAPTAPAPAAAGADELKMPPFLAASLFAPLPGAQTRGVAISEWESYRTDVAGKDIVVTTDDSNLFRDRNGKLNGNTGDTDASGLNVTDATDSTILGTESADEAPWKTVAEALVDIATSTPGDEEPSDDEQDVGDDEQPDLELARHDRPRTSTSVPPATLASLAPVRTAALTGAAAAAVVVPPPSDEGDEVDTDDQQADDDDDGDADEGDGSDFPYVDWIHQASAERASAVHTDEGTTLASGADALVIGADGYDDDDNRASGENIVITRDDGNVVIGGTGDVNAQIGDSEQGAVVMGVNRTYIQGGGAY